MTRKDFLKNIGVGAAFVLTVPCLHSCGSDDDSGEMTPSAGPQNFTVDLDAGINSALLATGGFIVRNKVVVALNVDDEFVAASQVCSHEGNEEVSYNSATNVWLCSVHGAQFAVADGEPQNDVTNRNLRIYTVTRSGNILTVNG
ncbi:MAG: ubiquinol-cytochrome c reductase iron-sulfur subunit [Saprospiraceae bacterium]